MIKIPSFFYNHSVISYTNENVNALKNIVFVALRHSSKSRRCNELILFEEEKIKFNFA